MSKRACEHKFSFRAQERPQETMTEADQAVSYV